MKKTSKYFFLSWMLCSLFIASEQIPGYGKAPVSLPENKVEGDMLVSEALHPDGYHVKKYLGCVFGIAAQYPASGPLTFSKAFTGGRMPSWDKACTKGTEEAYDEMVQKAQDRGANAVLGVHVSAGYIASWYGDAVILEPNTQSDNPIVKEQG